MTTEKPEPDEREYGEQGINKKPSEPADNPAAEVPIPITDAPANAKPVKPAKEVKAPEPLKPKAEVMDVAYKVLDALTTPEKSAQ